MALSFRDDLLPSRRSRYMRRIALALTTAAAAACLVALLLAPSGVRLGAAFASIAALGAAALRRREAPATGLAVAADGTIRIDAGGESRSVVVGYCGEQLVCLQAAGRRITVWPDALTESNWRRLLVACRWPHAPDQDSRATVRTN